MGDADELDLDALLLPGDRTFTFGELAEQGGVDVEELRVWWTSAGFADLRDDDQRAFSQEDVEIVRDLAALFSSGAVEPEAVLPGAQSLGQAMYRLAEWQAPMVREFIDLAEESGAAADVAASTAAVIDRMEHLQTRIWRRHLSTATQRLMMLNGADALTAHMAVGFADMVGYTRLSRGLAVEELNTLVSAFEARMGSVIYGGGGWIIKNVGDEVMFAAEDPATAGRIALTLQEPHDYPELEALDIGFPQLRVGIAYGELLQRYGDLFGSVVNLAARLTSATRPGTVLVDATFAEAIADAPDLTTRSLRSYRARGFRAVHPHLLRWATDSHQPDTDDIGHEGDTDLPELSEPNAAHHG